MTGVAGSTLSILVVGSTMIDLVAFADRLPDAGETVVGERFIQGFGGKGANQAVMAARFGAAVAMVGTVGDDANGRLIVDNLRAQGVATDDVSVAVGSSGVAPIWVDGDGMNRIIVIPGTNGLVSPAAAAAAVERIRPAVVVGQFEIPQPATAAAFAAARAIGAVTILNPAPGASIAPDLLASLPRPEGAPSRGSRRGIPPRPQLAHAGTDRAWAAAPRRGWAARAAARRSRSCPGVPRGQPIPPHGGCVRCLRAARARARRHGRHPH